MKREWLISALLTLLLPTLMGCGRSEQTVSQPAVVRAFDPNEDIFTNATLLRIQIEIPRSGMRTLRGTEWGAGTDRPETKATVSESGVVYKDVAIHLKGAAGSFRPVDDRPALTLKFDKYVPGQSFHGLNKISLNNSVQDSSFLSEKICRELFIAAGVPVPRAGHALVRLNGRDLGLYVLLEGANKQFLKKHFANAKGNLYDGGFVRDISEEMPVNSGDNPKDNSGLRTLIAAMRDSVQGSSLASLEKALDVDRFLSMMAMEVITCHWDGYAMNKNNWRLFHDLEANKMVFIPHGLDQCFGVGQPRDFSRLERTHWEGGVARIVMRTAEGRRRFRERIGQLYTNVFDVERITARIDSIEDSLQPGLMAWNPSEARAQEREATRLKQSIVRRGAELRRQLGATVKPMKLDRGGVIRLSNWNPSAVKKGEPIFSQSKENGKTLLSVRVGNGLTTGSWRTRAILPDGRYQFEGLVRVGGVTVEPNDGRAGAGLRTSKGPMPPKLSGTTDWQKFTYEFEAEEGADVEFICELKALAGTAWFDMGSLTVTRLP